MTQMKEWIARYWANHKDIPEGHYDGEVVAELIRCKDCKYYRADGDCWHEWDNDGRIYYQSIINEPNPDDYCSRAERKEE